MYAPTNAGVQRNPAAGLRALGGHTPYRCCGIFQEYDMGTPTIADLIAPAHLAAGTARAEAVLDAMDALFPIAQTLAAYHRTSTPAEPVFDSTAGVMAEVTIGLPTALTTRPVEMLVAQNDSGGRKRGWAYDHETGGQRSAHVLLERQRQVQQALLEEPAAVEGFWRAATEGLPLLGGATRFTLSYGWSKPDVWRAAFAVDGMTVWNQVTPCGPTHLRKRLVPLFSAFTALDDAFGSLPATKRWCSVDMGDTIVAAPHPEGAFYKRMACLQPHAPFHPGSPNIGHKPIAKVVDQDLLADRVADLRRRFCPTGVPLL